MILNDNIYLFSNRIGNKRKFFQGYCFIGSDYIYGEEGALEYIEKNGSSIPGGEDGCYVYVENKEGIYTFVNDYHGYKKIFYYHREGVWVVSNSIVKIAEFLVSEGERVNPNYAQLAAIGASDMSAMQQLSSYNTFVDGVKLLPSQRKLEINDSCCKITKQIQRYEGNDYAENLAFFLNTWVARAETLLKNNKMQVTCNLTGGVDSRACFAIFQTAKKRLENQHAKLAYTCGVVGGDRSDLEVATFVANECGERINDTVVSKANAIKGKASYDMWRYLCLGAYHPVYLPGREADPYIIKIMGGGGGNHRSVYSKYIKSRSIYKFANFCSKKVNPSWLSHQVYKDVVSFFKEHDDEQNHSKDPLINHYIAFRNRFHAGRTPQNMVTFNPLGSKYSDITLLDASVENSDTAKINYDIIFSLDSKLLDIPFDRAYKSPDNEIREKLVKVTLSEKSSVGDAYVGESVREGVELDVSPSKNKYIVFSKEVRNALNSDLVKSFWGKEKVIEAEAKLGELEKKGKFFHAKDGQLLSAFLASSFFFKE